MARLHGFTLLIAVFAAACAGGGGGGGSPSLPIAPSPPAQPPPPPPGRAFPTSGPSAANSINGVFQGATQDSLYDQPASPAGSIFQVDIIDPDDSPYANTSNVRESFFFDGDETIRVRFTTPGGSFDHTFGPVSNPAPNVSNPNRSIIFDPPTNTVGATFLLHEGGGAYVRLVSAIESQGTTGSVFNRSYAFGLIGQALPAADMPTSGTGQFAGNAIGVLSQNMPTAPESWSFEGVAKINVNFAASAGAVTGTIDQVTYANLGLVPPPAVFTTTLSGDLNGSAFSGTTSTTGLPGGAVPGTIQGQVYGDKSRALFGPAASEIGAVFQANNLGFSIIGGLIASTCASNTITLPNCGP